MTLDELARSLGYQPDNLRWILIQLTETYPAVTPAEATGDLPPAAEATIRSLVGGVEHAVRHACPDLR